MRLEFETATLADVINKAARVAPTKGSAFDKAAGILVTFKDGNTQVEVRATNLDLSYLEIVDAVEVEGDGDWRFPSQIFAGVLAKLPIGSGKTVVLEGTPSEVRLKAGRTTAKFRTIDASYYPTWEAFNPEDLELVPDLGARIQMVDWAANQKGDVPLSGVYIDNEKVLATDRFRIAMVPCEAEPIYKPVVIPTGILAPLAKQVRDVAVGIEGGQLLMMPDMSTQLRAITFGVDYPNVSAALKRNQPSSCSFRKAAFLDMVSRAMVFAQGERIPSMTVYLGKGELAVMIEDQEMGLLGDVVDAPGAEHNRMKMLFTPKNIVEAVEASPSEEITMHYFSDDGHKAIRLDGGSGYEAWVMPRREHTGGGE